MSYSRWGGSVWYTYWSSSRNNEIPEKSRRRKKYQTFEICGIARFFYHELIGDMEACIKKVKEDAPSSTEEQLEELRGYMREFIRDMDNEPDLLP